LRNCRAGVHWGRFESVLGFVFIVNNWNWTTIVVTTVVVLGLFGYLWWQGQIQRLAVYVQETREELRKCSWPSWEELKGSTLLVFLCVAFLGVFVYVLDQVLIHVFIIR
jgi:preprotein translocase subunit SecE